MLENPTKQNQTHKSVLHNEPFNSGYKIVSEKTFYKLETNFVVVV